VLTKERFLYSLRSVGMTEGEKGRRGEGEKGRRGEGEKGRRGEGEKGRGRGGWRAPAWSRRLSHAARSGDQS